MYYQGQKFDQGETMRWFIPLLLALTACSSTSTINGVKYEQDRILSTCNDSSKPDWADESKPFKIDGQKVYSLGVTTIPGDDRPEAGERISQNSARANIAQSISDKLEFIFQQSEETTGFNTETKYIGSEVSDLTSHSITLEGNWWKRYVQYDEDGPHVYYKIYSLITMPISDFKEALYKAIHGISDKKLSESFQTQVSHQWDRFIEGKKGGSTDNAAMNQQQETPLSQVASKKDAE